MAPRPRSPQKRELILNAAAELFAADGFRAVTVPQIARRAGVGLGTLYRRFPSKDALANAVFRRSKRAWARWTLDDWPAEAPPEQQFRTYWARLQAFAEQARPLAICAERRPEGYALDAESLALRAALTERIVPILDGWLHAPGMAPLTLEVVEALVHGTFWRVAETAGSPKERAALLEEARDAVWRALHAAP